MIASRSALAAPVALTLALAGLASSACAGPSWGYPDVPGRLVSVRVEVGGDPSRLYPDPRGTGRFYLEARQGAPYEIHLGNRTGERVGVVVTVDGLNVVSGEREGGRGRMYVLDPWGETTIKGWRSSLHDVRRFTFVDEQASYAARAGKANGRMGWIEVGVYRELGRPSVCCDGRDWHGTPHPLEDAPDAWSGREGEVDAAKSSEPGARRAEAPPVPSATPGPFPEAEAQARVDESKTADAPALGSSGGVYGRPAPRLERPRSFPGTGWGSRLHDPVVVVDFRPEPNPFEQVILRYEYAASLRALGIRVGPDTARDRLRDRERGAWGFAQPPTR